MKDYTVWISYHKDEFIKDYGLVEDDHHKLFATHKPADGENINILNPVYSEMVTMWYVWKNNIKSDYVGFEHYRRHLKVDFMPDDGYCIVYNIVDMSPYTLYKQYNKYHNKADLDLVIGILDDFYGTNNIYIQHLKDNCIFIPNCTFLMKWDDFTLLCNFMFGVIDEYCKRVGIEGYGEEALKRWQEKAHRDFKGINTTYQTRMISFFAERLISAWISSHLLPIVSRQ